MLCAIATRLREVQDSAAISRSLSRGEAEIACFKPRRWPVPSSAKFAACVCRCQRRARAHTRNASMGMDPLGRRETWREQLCRGGRKRSLEPAGSAFEGIRPGPPGPPGPLCSLAGADPLQNCTLSNLPAQIWSLASFDADWYSDVLESRSRAS